MDMYILRVILCLFKLFLVFMFIGKMRCPVGSYGVMGADLASIVLIDLSVVSLPLLVEL
jgi:hypothetical protein